jgi:hypothetical protein
VKSIALTAVAAALAPALVLAGCNKPAPGSAPASTAAAPQQAASAAATDDSAAAKAFLEGVYTHYKTAPKDSPPFDITSTAVVDPELAQLIKDDNKALKGDVGVLDSDWMCNCQDFVSIRATIAVQSATASTAKATADVVDTGMTGADAKPRRINFDLAKVNGQWRIHDVRNPGQPSLREALTKEIADLKKSPSKG